MSFPVVSIIIPAFNPGRYLREAVASAVAQTLTDSELIVVDDGSAEDLSWVVAMDSRIILHRQENRGLSAARNAGIMRSRGDLIAFLDADDVWLPGKLAAQVQALADRPCAVMAHSQMRFIDSHGKPGGLGWGGGYTTYDELLGGNGVCVSSVVARREMLFAAGLFDPLLATAQDYDLWLKLTRFGPMLADPESLVLYRWHENNMSRNYMRTHRELCAILRRHEALARAAGNFSRVKRCKRGIKRTRVSTALQACDAANVGGVWSSFRHLTRATRTSPAAVGAELVRRVRRRLRKRKAVLSP